MLRICNGPTRREWLRAGGLGAVGLSMPSLLGAAPRTFGRAKRCIVLFMLGGPPQHETWDPKPDAPSEIRGDAKPIKTSVPGLWVGEWMPRTAKVAHLLTVLRAVRTADNAHSTSGYAMSTGVPHLPLQVEGAAPGSPNDWPCLGGVVRRFLPQRGSLPNAVVLPEVAANDGGKTWPGQDAGLLGRASDPWVLEGDASAADFRVPDLTLAADFKGGRFDDRRSLLRRLDRTFEHVERSGAVERFDIWQQQAFELLASPRSREAFDLTREPDAVRDRYGRTRFGQGVLLARRLIEAGVSLVQVNWTRIDGAPNNGHWDTHAANSEALRDWLMPRMDLAYSALLEDLEARGLLQETLVVWMGEFGRTPKINPAGGRDHWGNVFSVALAGGGVKRGFVHGASDRLGAEPDGGVVSPADLAATIHHCLGLGPEAHITDTAGRPHPLSSGRVISEIL